MKSINCKGKLLNFETPLVMGILNVTPDSFYDGGNYTQKHEIISKVEQLLKEGASIIDVGAFSSKPYAEDVSEKDEISRLNIALKTIRAKYPEICISVDTFRSNVAKFVVENYEVDIINDIYAGFGDEKMLATISDLNVVYVMMHMQGTPKTMQKKPHYDNIVLDIIKFFSERINKATLYGINDIIIDPGFGFGKTIEHNFKLLQKLHEFKIIDYPLLVGLSRKSMIYKTLNITPAEALPATVALNTMALLKGAKILRVHDVNEAVQSIKMTQKTFSN